MKARVAGLVALAAAVTLTSVAAAGPEAAKQRVEINMKIYPQKTFGLMPFRAGALKRDSGSLATEREAHGREVMRNGQKVTIYDAQVWTLTGKQGTLTIRERTEWVDVSNENTRYGYPPVSPPVPGRSCAGQASTPRSSEVGEARPNRRAQDLRTTSP
jgi:hypothetical protein